MHGWSSCHHAFKMALGSGCLCDFLLWFRCVPRLACEPKGFDKQVPLFFSSLGVSPCKASSILAEGAIALSVTPSGGAQFAS